MSQKQLTPLEAYNSRIKDGRISPDPEQRQAVESLQRLYDELLAMKGHSKWKFWEKPDLPHGIYMHGGVGRGKSMLMDLFFDCVPEHISKRRVHFHAFMIDVHDYLHTRREADDFGDGVDGALPALANLIAERSQVLCFDEFHVTDVADAMILGRLFTALFDRGVIVVATSNWEPGQLYEGGLQRERFLPFIVLLADRLEVVHLDHSTDYRSQCLTREGTYFWPLGTETRRMVNGVFNHLTDDAPTEQEELEVKGRKIAVEAVVKGVARFGFAQLCEQPYGAEDYLKIADTYDTVFLEGVPKMGYDRRNEAKRLMNLIDALYESGTKLVVSADAPPEKLYYGDDHAFEFERTVSRLMEMQSEEYLAKIA